VGADARVHPVSRGLGITALVLGGIAILMPLVLWGIAMLPGQMNMLWFMFFIWPVSLVFAAIGAVVGLIGVIVGFAARRGTPVLAIIGTVVDVLIIATMLWVFSGGLSAFL
jgi:hypothetical protein